MNENDKKLNENFIKCQPKSVFKTGMCLFAGCDFSNKLTFNLKRHMRSCDHSPGKVAYRKRIQEVTTITEVTPVNIFENESINCNNRNSWGCPYSNKIIDRLHYFFNMQKTKDKNIVNLVLKDLIYQGNLEESLKLIDNMIHIYHGLKWINNNDFESEITNIININLVNDDSSGLYCDVLYTLNNNNNGNRRFGITNNGDIISQEQEKLNFRILNVE